MKPKLRVLMTAHPSMNIGRMEPRASVPFLRLRRALHESGLTQEQAGQLVGVDAKQVRRDMARKPRSLVLCEELERIAAERKRAA